MAQFNFIFGMFIITSKKFLLNIDVFFLILLKVVGAEEEATNSVNNHNRDDACTKAKGQTILLEESIEKSVKLKDEKRLKNSLIPDEVLKSD